MARCAVVQSSDNVCINIIVADNLVDWAPLGCFLVDADLEFVDIGFVWTSEQGFFNPNPEQPEVVGL